MPLAVAIVSAEFLATLPLLIMIWVFVSSAGALSEELPKYQDRLTAQITTGLDDAIARMVPEEQRDQVRQELTQGILPNLIQTGAGFVQQTIAALTSAMGTFVLTLILSAFMLFEARHFKEKIAEAFGTSTDFMSDLQGIASDVRRYVVAKTFVSAVTALSVFIFLEFMEVDFAPLWGLLAFPLIYPDSRGLGGSVPPVIRALIDPTHTTLSVVGVTIGLMVINGAIGMVIDPRYVGNAVRLSPLVVFMSMLVWGLLWGPIGMILAVPIMVCVKVVSSRIPGLEPVGIMLKG